MAAALALLAVAQGVTAVLLPTPLSEVALTVPKVTYRLAACDEVPEQPRPVPVDVRAGRSRGAVRVGLPQLPSDAASAGVDDVVEWQQVLVRDLCG